MSKVKILVCCHKKDNFKNDDIYMPIHVGKSLSNINLGIQGDNTGENISNENPHFCELTGLYWAWKNMEPVDYIGLCHYRRYFNFNEHGTPFSDCTIIKSNKFNTLDLSIPNMDKIFKHYNVILAKPKCYPYSLAVDYSVCQISEDLRTLFSIVNDLCSDYMPEMKYVFGRNNKLSHYNMMIMKWDDFTKYCEWLFNILFEASRRINIEHYNAIQGRIWGYMSERLLCVYVRHQNMKVKYYPIYWVNDNKENHNLLHNMQHYLRAQLSFLLQKSYRG